MKENLAFHKLVKDLVGTNAVLAGTLHTPDNIENSRRAKVIKTGNFGDKPGLLRMKCPLSLSTVRVVFTRSSTSCLRRRLVSSSRH
ncbi:hypothetical protein ARMGADRAFT_114044 [Armillaria gallica]|uniref:Uncharacterized protein n=1 Tax=Armillaria gallica TaxID=47427 RepID=A0A2H3DFN3_ARMGA|nr:hypothetical protein ARMGADRAFT_114044 [Armillaria gallica]